MSPLEWLIFGWISGITLAIIVAAVMQLGSLIIEAWDRHQDKKKITLLPDGKGGFITLPKGSQFIPLKPTDKN